MHIVSTLAFLTVMLTAATSHADDVCLNAPEAAGFVLVYTLNIPNAANYSAAPVPYAVDNHLGITGPVDRIAYCLELETPGGQKQFVFASMDAFTQDLRLIGIPTGANGAYFQRNVRNMNVASNVDGISGTALAGGYRHQLFQKLTWAGRTFEFIGSAGGNPSVELSAASQVNHEGHSGYRVDHLANNLNGNDGTSGVMKQDAVVWSGR